MPPDSGDAGTKPGVGAALDIFLCHLPEMAAPVLPRCMALCGRAVPGGNFSVSTGFSVRASDVAASENPDLPTKKGVAELA